MSTTSPSAALYRRLVETCASAVTVQGPDGTIRYASDAFFALLGFAADELDGHNPAEFLHPNDLERNAGLFAELVAAPGNCVTVIYRHRHRDGSWRWMKGTATNLLHDPEVGGIAVFQELYTLPKLGIGDIVGDSDKERYRIVEPLGRGGMAELFMAVRSGRGGLEKRVALKRIHRELLESEPGIFGAFVAEARLAANLTHPNIAQLYEIIEQAGELFIAMEYIDGTDLSRLLQPGGRPIALDDILHIGISVAAALEHAHHALDVTGRRLRIIHRDVSPSNIMISRDGYVKLVDFGVGFALADGAPSDRAGKTRYMSPEQRRGDPVDERSDIFALGVVLAELLCKDLPCASDPERRHQDLVTGLATVAPAELLEVLQLAIATDRDARFESAAAFAAALARLARPTSAFAAGRSLGRLLKR